MASPTRFPDHWSGRCDILRRYLPLAWCWLLTALSLTARAAWAANGSADTTLPGDWLGLVVRQHGLWVGVLATFLGGLLLNVTPCVYPMIPVTVAFFSGQAAGNARRTTLLAFLYILGIASSYALLGVLAAGTGALLGSWLQQPVVLVGIALVIVALALSMFGVYDLRVPTAITSRVGQASAGRWGAFMMGLIVGVVAAPCIGPFVLGLLLVVSKLGNPVAGFLLFFTLGLGMGAPYLILGLAAHRVGRLPKAGAWLVWSKQGLGIVLLGLALYFVRPLLLPAALKMAVVGWLLGAGVYLGWLERSPSRSWRFTWVRRIVGSGLLIAALAVVWPRAHTGVSVAWEPYTEAALARAQQEQAPVLVDVYADWCIPCVELDHVTFRSPAVLKALEGVRALRIDATREVPPAAQKLLERYEVYGVPTVLLFDGAGREHAELRVLGFVEPEDFVRRLAKIR